VFALTIKTAFRPCLRSCAGIHSVCFFLVCCIYGDRLAPDFNDLYEATARILRREAAQTLGNCVRVCSRRDQSQVTLHDGCPLL
jgi:hypothetical protein